MGVFTLSGVVLSIPIGTLLQRYSLVRGTVLAAVALLVGTLVGAFAQDAPLLLVGRVLEGIGLSIIVISGQAIITAWFPDRKRGLPTGLLTSWLPASSLITYLVAPSVALQHTWRGVWWAGVALAALAVVAALTLVRLPADYRPLPAAGAPLFQWGSSRDPWLLGAYYGLSQGAAVAFRTWLPTFLFVAGLAALEGASLLVSLWFIAGIAANPVGGLMADRFRRRKPVYLASVAVVVPVFVLAFYAPTWGVVALLLVGGCAIAFAPAPALTVAVRLPGQAPSVSIGILRMVNNIAIFAIPWVSGWAFEVTGEGASVGYVVAAMSVVGLLAGWLVREPGDETS